MLVLSYHSTKMLGNLECDLVCEMNQGYTLVLRNFWRDLMQTSIGLFCCLIKLNDRVRTACPVYWLSEKILTVYRWQHSKSIRNPNNALNYNKPGLEVK